MLKQRVKNIEVRLDSLSANKDNIEPIYQFFLTGDKNLLNEEYTYLEIYIAAQKAKEKGLKKCPGLLLVFNCLKEEGLVKNENEFFEYLRTIKNPEPRIFFQPDIEGKEEEYDIMATLRIFDLVVFVPAKSREEIKQD